MKNLNAKKEKNEINILPLGSSPVGKTSIIYRYINNSFLTNYITTLGIDWQFKKMTMEDGTELKVKITDTSGQEKYSPISSNYIKKSDGVVITYDITDRKSFDDAKYWINQINESYEKKIIFLVGNKSDLEDKRVIYKEEGKELAEKYGAMFSECSALTGENVDFIFNELIKKFYQEKKREIEREEEKIILIGKNKRREKEGKKIEKEEKKRREKEEKEEKKRREIEEKKRREIEEKEENERRKIEEKKRREIEEEKAKKNLKILNKYISY